MMTTGFSRAQLRWVSIIFFAADLLILLFVIIPRLCQEQSDLFIGIIQAVTGSIALLPLLFNISPSARFPDLFRAFRDNHLLQDIILISAFWIFLIVAIIFPQHDKQIETIKTKEAQVYIASPPNEPASSAENPHTQFSGKANSATEAISPDLRLDSVQSNINSSIKSIYTYKNSKDGIREITFNVSPKEMLDNYLRYGIEYPKLLINIINNTNEIIVFDSVDITIESSKINIDPLLSFGAYVIKDGKVNFSIYNYGWGSVKEPVIEYTIHREQAKCENPDGVYRERISLNEFDSSSSITLNTNESEAGNFSDSLYYKGCVIGKLSYKTQNGDVKVSDFNISPANDYGYGGFYDDRDTYNISLKLQETPTVNPETISVNREIQPGNKTDYFYISIGGDQSAIVDLKFSLRAGNRIVHSKQIKLNLFVPRLPDQTASNCAAVVCRT